MHDIIPMIGLAIPIVGMLGGFLIAITAILTKASARRHEMELKYKQAAPVSRDLEIKALKEELASFKDTSTQYDMSLEHTLQRIEQRISRLEQPEYRPNVNPVESEPVQTIGRR
jgi:hypothetical protein